MKTMFICPDLKTVPIAQCLSGKCRMKERCCPMSYLHIAGHSREWTGEPSVTQLLNGTRQEWLKIQFEYAESPDDAAFRILGTGSHAKMEQADNDFSFIEERLKHNGVSGMFDAIEQQPDGSYWLIDYKTSGSYKVGQALGIVAVDDPLYDDHGVPVTYKTGAKKGEQKTRKIYVSKPENAEMRDWILQLNKYRIMAEHALNEPIARLKIFSTVRDGGTFTAKNRGISQNTYYINVPMIDEEIINSYFERKRSALLTALDNGTIPDICTPEECWNGRRCQDYCPVKDRCPDNPYVQTADEQEVA